MIQSTHKSFGRIRVRTLKLRGGMEFTGTVTGIKFRNEENGWTVLRIKGDDGEELTAVGVMPSVNDGEHVTVTGNMTAHPMYGEQIRVTSYKNDIPTSAEAVRAYLASGFIKGIGEATARLLVDKFGAETLEIIKTEPMKLTKISGIGPKKAKMIHESYIEKAAMQDIIMGMQELGLSIAMTMKIYKLYGENCVSMVKENPYSLIDDFENVGFKTADKIAFEAGYERESEFRVRAGIKYALSLARQEGNTCLPRDMLVMFAANNVLGVVPERVEAVLEKMLESSSLVEKRMGERDYIFLKYMHYVESDCAALFSNIVTNVDILSLFDIDGEIKRLEKQFGVTLAAAQNEAVKRAVTDGVLIVTGGPGTGKTTILKFVIEIMEHLGLQIELAAPTGRASKRISDTTGREARTLHRLLEYNFNNNSFNRNADYPVEADVIIIDEMSMVDVMLFHSLLKAVAKGTRLVMVGDVDQLPSVGPGNVLRDLVNSDVIPVIRLNEIFRQAGRSRIVTNAHLINRGEMPVLDNIDEENDFLFYECPTADIALSSVLNLCGNYAYIGKINELQVLSPMKGNMLGVVNLNTLLQTELNPAADDKAEFKFGEITFREGDRVMQIKNNYDIQWRKTKLGADDSEGEGVFNGDIGTILRVDNASKFITVLFDDERVADYNFNQLEEIDLAYCISVHKSQGSEFPCVVLPLVNGPNMLFNRNILYTAVTRARSKVYILGSVGCIKYMVSNTNVRRRYSALETFLRERNETLPDV